MVSSSIDVLERGFSEDDDDVIASTAFSVIVDAENPSFSSVTSGHRFSSLAVMKSVVDSITFSVIIPSDSVKEEECNDEESEVLESMLVISSDKVEEISVDEDESSVISSVGVGSIFLSVILPDSGVGEESDEEKGELLELISVIELDEVEKRSCEDVDEDESSVEGSVISLGINSSSVTDEPWGISSSKFRRN